MADYNSIEEIFAAGIDNMTIVRNNNKQDDGVDTVTGASWFKFNGVVASSIYVSGNSFVGFGNSTEHLKVNRRDTAMWYLYWEEGTLYNYYRFLKIRWRGYTHYSATDTASLMEYDVLLWENGCISLHMVSVPTSSYSGTFSLTAASTLTYNMPTANTPDVTFTPQDDNHTTFTVTYTMIDLVPPYDRKYLVRSGTAIYTVTDGTLTALNETSLTASLFQTYGVDEMPTGSLIAELTDPEVLYWHDSEDEPPDITISVTGTPPVPQVVVTNAQDMSDSTILGIESVIISATDDVLWAISFDDGVTWKAYDGNAWVTLEQENSGMTAETFQNISLEAWAEVVTSTRYRVRFVLMDLTSHVESVVFNYINP